MVEWKFIDAMWTGTFFNPSIIFMSVEDNVMPMSRIPSTTVGFAAYTPNAWLMKHLALFEMLR